MQEFIFVYGTLKNNYHNSALFADSPMIGEAQTVEPYQTYSEGIPYVIHPNYTNPNGPSRLPVKGQVWSVTSPDILRSLDGLEGHPDWYRREKIMVQMGDGFEETAEVWCYLMPNNMENRDGHSMPINEDGIYEY
jgi:gamma-glutamylcyclotransferase (GGCT)/AIG2-like uncharacterized protein YtfP